MVRLREIPRTAAFAWSPGPELPLVVTGTRAGAVDAEFSDETKLELWDLRLDNLGQGLELQPVASINTDSRFHDIAWAPANEEHPRGIIAGALENGSLDLWDAAKLIAGESNAFMSRTTKHTGAIKSLQFNPLKPQILATAGAKGELYIYDVNDISNPFRLGTPQARADDLECIAWNRKVPHILATGGTGGFVTIWDLKTKKASLSLSNHKKPVAAIAWDPNNATKLLTATPDDSNPVILLWDLRNSNAPERTLQGHEQGVLSLSWCQQDSDLLLSCGKDNKTLCWNPQTGELIGEFPEVTNWTFQTRFHPHNPSLSATASFDGKISIQTLQNTNSSVAQPGFQAPSDGEDFFTRAQTQPQGSSFSLKKAPKWLERPVGASFGFGGKLVIFRLQPTASGQVRTSRIQISTYAVDSDIGAATENFEDSLKAGDINGICHSHIDKAKTEDEKADWEVIETLIAENPRKRVTEYLGVAGDNKNLNDANGKPEIAIQSGDDSQENGTAAKKSNRLSTFFADGGAESEDFLSNMAATKGAKTNNPFELFSESDSSSDGRITRALMLGQFEVAMKICLKEDRMADAFMIANCGGKELVEIAQAAYLAKKDEKPSYLRLLAAVIGKNLWDLVYNADLANWKETMATLCTYADPSEFPDLCEALGDRILESGSRKNASFCYLVGSNLEKVVEIWITELQEHEKAVTEESDGGSTFSVHARSLQNFIEKVTVFREVTKFLDKDRAESAGWKLQPLYEKYIEYADIVAAHGFLSTAEKYLDLLPAQYPTAEVARNRVKLASRAPTTARTNAHQLDQSSNRSASRVQPIGAFAPQPSFSTIQTPAASNLYPPPVTSVSNPYAPSPTNTFSPQAGYLPPQQSTYGAPTMSTSNAYGQPANSFGPPPRNTGTSIPPPSQSSKMSNWNDTPLVTKPAVSRRSTPGIPAPITSPYGNQPNILPPTAPPFAGARSTPTPPPPPPKGPAPPRVTSPLHNEPLPAALHAPPSVSIPNPYAPPLQQPAQQFGQSAPPPSVARGASPYNPPPTGPPPTNRYAPAPAPQQYSSPPAAHTQLPPPPGGSRPPPSSQYAPSQPPLSSQGPYAPNQSSLHTQPPPQQNQAMQGPPPGSRAGPPQSQPLKPSTPAAPKYPPGDRSHIPPNAQQMVSILSNEMQRIAGKAPASYASQVENTQKRLNMLFDHLNNETLVKPDTIETLNELANALQGKNYDLAAKLQVDIQRDKTDECGNWMVGVKRLISMCKVTP